MPETLKEWLWFLGVAFVFLYPMEAFPNDDRCGAASEYQVKPSPQDCEDLHYDIRTIARAISDGAPKEVMVSMAQRSHEQLSAARLANILKMIEAAYAHEGPIINWMNAAYKACMKSV